MEFRADAEIDHVGQGCTIVHAHVILVLEALDLRAHNTLRHPLVPYVHWVIHPWDGLGCVAQGKRVHLRAQTDKLDDQIALGHVIELTHFSGV